jgi:hypothetical protein
MFKNKTVPIIMLLLGAGFIILGLSDFPDHWWKEIVLLTLGVIFLAGGLSEGLD